MFITEYRFYLVAAMSSDSESLHSEIMAGAAAHKAIEAWDKKREKEGLSLADPIYIEVLTSVAQDNVSNNQHNNNTL